MSADLSKPPSLIEAGQQALTKFLPALNSPAKKQTYGLKPDDDLKVLTLGEPFRPHVLAATTIEHYQGGNITEKLVPGGNWFFPVRSKGDLACLLSVLAQQNGKFVEDSLGMVELAKAWNAITEAWPASKGYTPILVIVPTHQRFYFTVPQVNPPNLTRIITDGKDAGVPETYSKLSPASESIAKLRG